MKKNSNSIKCLYLYFFLTLLWCANLTAQSEIKTYTKIEELRASKNFNTKDTTYINLILKLAKEKIRTNPDTTLLLLKQAHKLCLTTKYKAGESIALSTYGYYYFEKGEVEKAYEYNMNALKVAQNNDLKKEKLIALNNMGLDFWLQGEEAKSLTKFMEALSVAKELNDIDRIMSLNVNIANLYSENGDYETSLQFLEIAKDLSTKNSNHKVLAYTLVNMANEYIKLKKYDEANEMINTAIEYFKKEEIIDWLSHAYEVKGSIALDQKKYKQALNWYAKAEKLCDEINFKYGYTILYYQTANAHLGLGNINKAETYALKGLAISTELKIAGTIKDSNAILAEVYNKKGEYKLAYEYLNTYKDLQEKSSTEKFKKGLGILRSKIKFEEQKEKLIQEQNKAIARQKNYVYFFIAALLIVSLFLLLIYRTNNLQKKYTQKLLEKQEILLKHEKELSDSNATKDRLFSIVAHDLKGPINSFHGLMKMSMDESISKQDYDMLIPKALKNIQNISEMLNNLLVWAKTQMEGIVVKQVNLDVNSIASKTILLLEPIAKKKDIKIINQIPKNTISYSDKNHLNIIIRNLISNAIKFTKLGGEINVSIVKKEHNLQLEVKDNGIGMEEETLNLLFKKKHIKSTFGTNKEKGTGLGLYICKEMVESNGGEIRVSSEKNKGTSIYFTLPLEEKNNTKV